MVTATFFLIGVFLVVLQTTIIQLLPSWLGTPELVFILVAFIAYRFHWLRGLFLVVSFGWMIDVVAGSYPGLFLFEYLIVFVMLSILTNNSPIKEAAYEVPLVGFSYFLVQALIYGALSLIDADSMPPWSWNRLLRETVIIMVVTIPFFILVNALYEHMQQRKTVSRIVHRKPGNRFR